MKVVTVETLAAAIEGYVIEVDEGTVAKKVFDALPATPLAEDVERAARGALSVLSTMRQQLAAKDPRMSYAELQFDDADVEDITTIIAALHAATAEVERLRAIERRAHIVSGRLSNTVVDANDVAAAASWRAVSYILHGDQEASDGA